MSSLTTQEPITLEFTPIAISDLKAKVKSLEEGFVKLREDISKGKISIEELKGEIEAIQGDISRLKKISEEVSWVNYLKPHGVWKEMNCRYAEKGLCNLWKVSNPEGAGISKDLLVFDDASKTWRINVAKFPSFCIPCALFEPRNR
jgi:hypothetical protein